MNEPFVHGLAATLASLFCAGDWQLQSGAYHNTLTIMACCAVLRCAVQAADVSAETPGPAAAAASLCQQPHTGQHSGHWGHPGTGGGTGGAQVPHLWQVRGETLYPVIHWQ